MGKGARISVAATLVLALVGLATWWLLAGRGEDASLAARGDAAAAALGALPDASPDASRSAPVPLADDAAVSDVAPDLAVDAAQPEPGDPVTFTGRVFDDAGRPVKDAEVVHLPTDAMRELTGLDARSLKFTLPWERFTRARTDAQGRFALPSREMPARGAPILDVDVGNSSTRGGIEGRLPRLLVLHPALEPTLFQAFAFARGEAELGDLVVSACGAVAGRCVDASGQPMAGVLVRVSPGDDPEPPMSMAIWTMLRDLPQTTSGPDGRFLLGSLWNVTLHVAVNAEGCVPWRKKVTLRARETTDLGDVLLDRGGEVGGWVLSQEGTPIAGARITMRPQLSGLASPGPDPAAMEDSIKMTYGGSGYELHTLTAADGSFRLGGIVPMGSLPWRVTAAADGFEPDLIGPVKAGAEPLHFALRPAAGIVLSIVEPGSATPVADATVAACRVAQGARGLTDPWPIPITANRDGEVWRIVGAGPERNQVIVSAPGFAMRGFELPGVEPGQSIDERVELPRAGVVAGRVVDEQGAPVTIATIRARPPAGLAVHLEQRRVRTDAQGLFQLGGLVEGDWSLVAAAEGFMPAEPVVQTVHTGEHVEGLELNLARGGSITGSILTRDLRAMQGREVRAEPAPGVVPPTVVRGAASMLGDGSSPATEAEVKQLVFKGFVDDRGAYAIRGLPAGSYHVMCHPGAQADVDVRAGAETHLDLALHDPARVHGRVLQAGAPVADAQVVVGGQFGMWWDEMQTTTTNAAGEYAMALGGEGPNNGSEVFARWKDSKTRSVKIDPHFDQDQMIDLLFGGGALEGEIVDEENQPVQTQVHWACKAREGFSEGDEVGARVDSDAAGHFRLERLPEGNGPLMVSKGGYVSVTLDVAVKEGQTTSVPRIVLRTGGAIEVHVGGTSDDPQDPTQRYLIRVRSLAEPDWKGYQVHVRFGATQTLKGIPAGNVEIDVLEPGAGPDSEPLRTVPAVVVAGQTTRFEQPAE